MSNIVYDKISNERLNSTREIVTEVNNLIRSEIKKYRRSDIILSERETLENEKIAKVLESLVIRISNLYEGN